MIRIASVVVAVSMIVSIALAQGKPKIETGTGILTRAPNNVPNPAISPKQRELMRDRFEELVEHAQGEIDDNPPSEPGRPQAEDPETILLENPVVLRDTGA